MLNVGLRCAASFAAAAATPEMTAGFGATGGAGFVRFGGATVRVTVRVTARVTVLVGIVAVAVVPTAWRTGVVTVVAVGFRATAWDWAAGAGTATEVVVVGDGGGVVDRVIELCLAAARGVVVGVATDTVKRPRSPVAEVVVRDDADVATDWLTRFTCAEASTVAVLVAGATTSTYVPSPDATTASASAL